ncbi:MAG TPA: 50S ribosomal protein L23 [Patescibacteria group bacterium]|nr:50S ribosomal protein L23 [Patescibacteria group bacterium]
MIKPVYTEKSLSLAKLGKYTFWVEVNADKMRLKSEIAKLFGVTVISIKTITVSGEAKRTAKGKKYNVIPTKKAIVTLKAGDKIDAFEEPKK